MFPSQVSSACAVNLGNFANRKSLGRNFISHQRCLRCFSGLRSVTLDRNFCANLVFLRSRPSVTVGHLLSFGGREGKRRKEKEREGKRRKESERGLAVWMFHRLGTAQMIQRSRQTAPCLRRLRKLRRRTQLRARERACVSAVCACVCV